MVPSRILAEVTESEASSVESDGAGCDLRRGHGSRGQLARAHGACGDLGRGHRVIGQLRGVDWRQTRGRKCSGSDVTGRVRVAHKGEVRGALAVQRQSLVRGHRVESVRHRAQLQIRAQERLGLPVVGEPDPQLQVTPGQRLDRKRLHLGGSAQIRGEVALDQGKLHESRGLGQRLSAVAGPQHVALGVEQGELEVARAVGPLAIHEHAALVRQPGRQGESRRGPGQPHDQQRGRQRRPAAASADPLPTHLQPAAEQQKQTQRAQSRHERGQAGRGPVPVLDAQPAAGGRARAHRTALGRRGQDLDVARAVALYAAARRLSPTLETHVRRGKTRMRAGQGQEHKDGQNRAWMPHGCFSLLRRSAGSCDEADGIGAREGMRRAARNAIITGDDGRSCS